MNRRTAIRIVQVVVTIAAFAWLSTRISLAELGSQLLGLPALVLLTATTTWTLSFVVAAVRWRWTMRAYGSTAALPMTWILRVCWAGIFYNTWAPGGVGGDLVRGVAARRAFPGTALGSTTAGIAITAIDRLLGLSGLLLLVGAVLTVRPIDGQEGVRALAALGTLAALSGVMALAGARRIAPLLPERLAEPLAGLPPLERPGLVAQGVLASILTHLLTALSGFAIVRGLHPTAALADALVFVPLSMATVYLPISVGGAGVREAAFAGLYGTVGVAESTAVAASLVMFGIQLVVSAVGGILLLLQPLGEDEPQSRD